MEGLSAVDRVFKSETIASEVKEWSQEVGKTDRVARMQLQGVSSCHLVSKWCVDHSSLKLTIPVATEEFENALQYLLESFKDAMTKNEICDFKFKTKLYNETGECLGKRVWKAEAEVPSTEMSPVKEPVISSVA
jgi:hypothetical protein